MDIATLLSVVHTLLAAFDALNYSELKEVWSKWKVVSNFDQLENVAVIIKNEFMDAEAKYTYDQLSLPTQQYIEELSFAIYDADDLLDEFVTLAQQKHLLHLQEDEFNQEVGLFFSHNDLLDVAGRMSQGINKIKAELDLLKATPVKFGLKGLRSDETCSYTDTEIIGRDDDVKEVVDKLLHSDVSALTIVGRGGIGKTALVQLVFNHERIKSEFSLRLWTCVSDHDRSNLDVKAILSQILESASGQKSNECLLEVVVNRVRELLLGKRCLIILDDLWTKSRIELQNLLGHLVGGVVGSRIVVTTRSKVTAKIMGDSFNYELEGLSDAYSWDLFRQTAFDKIDHERVDDSYVEKYKIGKDVIKKCGNVPLAIRVIGSLLYRQGITEWRQLQKFGLADTSNGETGIMPILKHSYHYLDYSLKSCFSYCSLYPKDFYIRKHRLIRLWIAQGFVVPCGNGQSIEDAGEECFSILLRRCFFQDVRKNECGEIVSFKLHDLMHDVALEVTKKEICLIRTYTRDMDKAVRHVSLTLNDFTVSRWENENFGTFNAHIRTCLCNFMFPVRGYTEVVLANYRRLRTLDLSDTNITLLPVSLGKLIHLRYLNLSRNDNMEVLPYSIIKLYNLQTLDLSFCWGLKEVPPNFSNLVSLRHLGLKGCSNLPLMVGMSKLINIHEQDTFNMGVTHSILKQQLEELKALKNLKGDITIAIHLPISDGPATDNTIREGGYIRDKEHLHTIRFVFYHSERNGGATDYEEGLLGALQPHENLKKLILYDYHGVRMPRWVIKDNLTSMLPNLLRFDFFNCLELQCLPSSLGNLQNLKRLSLSELPKLEYIKTPLEASAERLQFFPCLQKLTLECLPKLKGWGRSGEIGGIADSYQSSLVFSQLRNLKIRSCRNLTSLPGCPSVKTVKLYDFNERLRITSNPTSCLKLNEVTIGSDHSMSWLDSSVPIESLQSLIKLKIYEDNEVRNLGDFGRVFRACSSSLRELGLSVCTKLTSVTGGLCYLSALERLTLADLPIVNLADGEIERDVECDGMPGGALSHTLQHLQIENCVELKTFPKWMRNLNSLQQLNVKCCLRELYERCQSPNGEDWPNIKHIPCINFEKVGLDGRGHVLT